MIYLYAITEPSIALPLWTGLDGAPLRLAQASEVAGIYSAHERIEPQPEPGTLWRHEQVVEAAMRTAPTLPVRFGTTFADDHALVAVLEREGERIHDQLRRMLGCVELAVRVGLAEGPAPAPRDGRGYVEAKLARRRRQQAVARETLAPLRELAVLARAQESRSADDELCASYLVRSHAVEEFAEQVRLLADQNPELWVSCTGPWPPYSFAELEEAA